MKISIFIDLGFKVGFGHFKRACVLGHALEKAGFVVSLVALRGLEYLAESGFTAFVSSDLTKISHFLEQTDILIVDAPSFPFELLSVRKKLRLLVGIDELSELRDELDIHFCTSLLGLENRICQRGGTKEYIGPCYFIFGADGYVDPSFSPDSAKGFLSSFGGSDPGLITEKFFSLLLEISDDQAFLSNFTGIIGPGFTKNRVEYLQNNFPEIKWKSNLSDLSSELSRSFYVFCAGGITAYEALKCGALPVCIAQHEEQLTVIKNLAAHNLAICAGKFDNIDRELLENCLLRPYDYKSLCKSAVSSFYDLCDGFNGSARIVEIIRENCG